MAEVHNQHLRARVSKEFLAAVEKWRKGLSPIPSQSAAIRELVARGLLWTKEKAGKPRKP